MQDRRETYINMWEGGDMNVGLTNEVRGVEMNRNNGPSAGLNLPYVPRPQNADESNLISPYSYNNLQQGVAMTPAASRNAENSYMGEHANGVSDHRQMVENTLQNSYCPPTMQRFSADQSVGQSQGRMPNDGAMQYRNASSMGYHGNPNQVNAAFYPAYQTESLMASPSPRNARLTSSIQYESRVSSGADTDTEAEGATRERERTRVRRHVYRARSKSPPKYNGKFDFLDFQVQFECVAEDNGWDYSTCGKKLSRCLTDSARSILTTLDKSVRRDYKTLCAALMSLHTTPGGECLRRNELHQAVRAEGQCPSAFGREIRRLAARAYPNGNLPEPEMVQLFVRGMKDVNIERHVCLQAPDNLEEAIRQACAFQAYSTDKDTLRKPKSIVSAVKSENLETKLADLTDKYEKLLRQVSHSRAPARSDIECYSCHGKGHISRNCPLKAGVPRKINWPQSAPQMPANFNIPPPGYNWQTHMVAPASAPVVNAASPMGIAKQALNAVAQLPYPESYNSLNY